MPKKAIELNEAGLPTGRLLFSFEDKTEIEFDLSKVPEAVKARAVMHGFSQKIGDSYASASKAESPLAFAKAAVTDLIAQLYAGEWRATAEAGVRITDLAVALSRLTGKTAEESQAFVDTLDDEQKKAWRGKAKVKATLATIAAEKAAARAKKLAAAAATAEGAETDTDEEDIDFDVPEGEEA